MPLPLAGRQRLAHSDALQVGEHHIQVVCLTQSFNGEVRRNIFSDPDGIENKFNSEREHKVRHIVTPPPEARPKTSPARHLDSQDEITGVFDFSALQRGNGGDAPHLNPNINDGTRPLFMEEKKNPLVLIGVLSALVLILLGLVVYALYFKSGPKASDTPTSEFVVPSVAPPATP